MNDELTKRIDALDRAVKFTRPRCPVCRQLFVGWQERRVGGVYSVCVKGHMWVNELYVDYGPWPAETDG